MAPLDVIAPGAGPQSSSDVGERRYATLAIVLHWTIAALIVLQMCLGWYMNEILPDHSPAQARIEGLHISIGLTTFLLILVRIGIRLTHPAPPLPAALKPWEVVLAHASHLLFYLLMLALPLTGWALVSIHAQPISLWGLTWPHLPGLRGLAAPDQRPTRQLLQHVHTTWLISETLATIALHVAGALKHQFDGSPVLWRMAPFLRRPSQDR